jgi:hypothetical protein
VLTEIAHQGWEFAQLLEDDVIYMTNVSKSGQMSRSPYLANLCRNGSKNDKTGWWASEEIKKDKIQCPPAAWRPTLAGGLPDGQTCATGRCTLCARH